MSIDFISLTCALEELGNQFPPPPGYVAGSRSAASEMAQQWLADELVIKYRASRAAAVLRAGLRRKVGALDVYDASLGAPAYSPELAGEMDARLIATGKNFQYCLDLVRRGEVLSVLSGKPAGWNVWDERFTSLGFDRSQFVQTKAENASDNLRELHSEDVRSAPRSPQQALDGRPHPPAIADSLAESMSPPNPAGGTGDAKPKPVAATVHLMDCKLENFDDLFYWAVAQILPSFEYSGDGDSGRLRDAVWNILKSAAKKPASERLRFLIEYHDGDPPKIIYEGATGNPKSIAKESLKRRLQRGGFVQQGATARSA